MRQEGLFYFDRLKKGILVPECAVVILVTTEVSFIPRKMATGTVVDQKILTTERNEATVTV